MMREYLKPLQKDYAKDSWELMEEKNDALGLIGAIKRDAKETDEELEYSRLEELIDLYDGWKKELAHHVNETGLIQPDFARELEAMMDALIERRKKLPPFDADKLGLNKPYVKLPEGLEDTGLGKVIKETPWWREKYLFDPKTQSYINNFPTQKQDKEQGRGEVFSCEKKE